MSTVRRLLQLVTWQKRKGANTEQEENDSDISEQEKNDCDISEQEEKDSDSSGSEVELNSSPAASDVDEEQNTKKTPQPSEEALRRKYYRHRIVLQGLLPSNSRTV